MDLGEPFHIYKSSTTQSCRNLKFKLEYYKSLDNTLESIDYYVYETNSISDNYCYLSISYNMKLKQKASEINNISTIRDNLILLKFRRVIYNNLTEREKEYFDISQYQTHVKTFRSSKKSDEFHYGKLKINQKEELEFSESIDLLNPLLSLNMQSECHSTEDSIEKEILTIFADKKLPKEKNCLQTLITAFTSEVCSSKLEIEDSHSTNINKNGLPKLSKEERQTLPMDLDIFYEIEEEKHYIFILRAEQDIYF